MAKKKNKHKHSRLPKKPAERSSTTSSSASSAAPAVSAPPATALSKPLQPSAKVQPKMGTLDSSNRWYYVRGDLKRIVILASSCIVLELLLWYLLAYTSFGESIYQLIKI